MDRIEELRRQRAEVNAKVQELAQLEAENGELSEEQLQQFEELATQFEELNTRLERAERMERMNAASAKPVATFGRNTPAVHVKPELKQYTGAKVARMAMAVAAGKGDLDLAVKFAQSEIGDPEVVMAVETSANSGGSLVPQNLHDEIIELLRPRTVVRALGAQTMPLPNGNLSIPRMASGATSGYVGEGADVLASEASTDDVKLNAKTMITLVPMSNQLIGRAGFQVEQLFLNDMLASMAVREDKAFLRDDGTNDTPTGFAPTCVDEGRVVAWSGSVDLAGIDAYLDSLVLKLMESDSLLITPGWALSPRSYMKLFGLRDGNGNKVYPEMANGELKGWPIKHTTTIPVNLDTSGAVNNNESEIYFADWNDVVIGESDMMTIDFSREATYKDAQGNLVSAFARNQSLIRVVKEHDVAFRHPEGLVIGTEVPW
ncbi:phage major capsid protein [Halomonas daqingensis]|uniref:Phage major capsid protein n=1 Tax=Billgrantia desiderata TaxID=52021 RepID=A0ABS9B4K7_9GAMM|nr:phage major capsid protein [Halomonas desiderata]MCE8042441.1 phage major capsid protein [Halomonas desiderata]MCE8047016.1 phage major capsid protein [Halomonas desiderata]